MGNATFDVLVVGAGPSGAAAAYWLATRGHRVAGDREEALPAGEDVRRRPHAAGGPPAARHGSRRPARPGSSASTACGRSATASPSSSPGPTTPTSRRTDTWCGAASSTRWSPSGRSRPAPTLLAGHRGDRSRSSRTAWSAGAVVRDKDTGATRRAARPLRDRRRRRQLPLRTGARHRPRPHATPWVWRSAATSPARSTTSPWIESHLDIRDRDGNHLPGYGWIFPVGDGTVNVGRRPALDLPGLEERQHHPPDGGVLRDRPGAVGHLARDRDRRRRRAAGSRPAVRCTPRVGPTYRGRRATRPARSTRSTARASRSRTRPAGSPPTRSTSPSGPATARARDLRATPRRGVRPLLQGRACLRARHRQSGGHARADPRRACRAAR